MITPNNIAPTDARAATWPPIDKIIKYKTTGDRTGNNDGIIISLIAAKKGKNTSMWLAIDSVKKKDTDIVISAGNTGALLVIAKLNLKMIENIDKPALSALWPNKKWNECCFGFGCEY